MQNGATELDCKTGYSPFPADRLIPYDMWKLWLQKRLLPIPCGSIPYDKWKQLVILIVSEKILSFSFELK
jgi:hypothetical protein